MSFPRYGMANPNSSFDAKTVREIRLQHLCDGVSASQIARDLEVTVSCISRIVNWEAWAGQDNDLQVIPKPGHKGGIRYHLPKTKKKTKGPISPDPPAPPRSCRSCLHLNDSGLCGFDFPECLKSGYREAKKCNCYTQKEANHESPD